MKHFDLHPLMPKTDPGRSAHMKLLLLLVTVRDIAKNLTLEDQVDVILLDFSKAFDKAHHQRLLHKLQYYGVCNNTTEYATILRSTQQYPELEILPDPMLSASEKRVLSTHGLWKKYMKPWTAP